MSVQTDEAGRPVPASFTVEVYDTTGYVTCNKCDDVFQTIQVPYKEVTFYYSVTDMEATCENRGNLRFDAWQNELKVDIDGVPYTVHPYVYLPSDPLGHDWHNRDGVCARESCGKACDHSMNASRQDPGDEGGAVPEPTVVPVGGDTKNTHFPTCTQSAVCDICGKTLPALGHSFTKYVSNGDATCLADGTKTAVCDHAGCGAEKTVTDEGTALGHSFTNYVSNGDATCLADGTKTAVCDHAGCGAEKTVTDEGTALGHSFTNYVSNGDATCLADGTKTAVCDHAGCGAKDTVNDEGSALGHDERVEVIEPNCDQKGYTLHTCARCGHSYTDGETPALYHRYGEWQPAEGAEHTARCVRCGETAQVACRMTEYTVYADAENKAETALTVMVCPVCGRVAEGERLLMAEKTAALYESRYEAPAGDLVVRLGSVGQDVQLLTVCFEIKGAPVQPEGAVVVTLPASLVEGYTLTLLAPDGTETLLDAAAEDGNVSITLTFPDDADAPVQAVRLTPVV